MSIKRWGIHKQIKEIANEYTKYKPRLNTQKNTRPSIFTVIQQSNKGGTFFETHGMYVCVYLFIAGVTACHVQIQLMSVTVTASVTFSL